jgi:hypothetical protein
MQERAETERREALAERQNDVRRRVDEAVHDLTDRFGPDGAVGIVIIVQTADSAYWGEVVAPGAGPATIKAMEFARVAIERALLVSGSVPLRPRAIPDAEQGGGP